MPTSPEKLARTLDREGDARFFEKVRSFAHAIAPPADASEALYRGLMGGLGYGGNSTPMTRLAEAVPLRALERELRGVESGNRRGALAAAVVRASGLGDPASGNGPAPALSREEWKLFRVRPANHPARRLEGLAALLDRAWDAGLASWAASLVAEGTVASVRAGLTAAAEGGGALIGADRASDLAVNVALPFARALGNLTRNPRLSAAALGLYRAWPPLQENAVTEEAACLLGGGTDLRRNARRQQGLIRVYRRQLAGPAA